MQGLSAQRMTLYVADSKGDCYGISSQTCLQVKEKPGEPYSLFYSGIEGFSYEEGYNYHLEVMRVKKERVAADGSAFNYYLIRVISKERSKTYVQRLTPIPNQQSLSLERILRNGKMESVSGPDIYFDKRNGRISGKAGCNRYFGKVIMDNNRITLSGLGSTQMACLDNNNLESLFLQYLASVNRYQVKGNSLLFYRDNEILLQFALTDNLP